MNNKLIIGFIGKIGSGKTYLASYINSVNISSYLTSFAKSIKEIFSSIGMMKDGTYCDHSGVVLIGNKGISKAAELLYFKIKNKCYELFGKSLTNKIFSKDEKNTILKTLLYNYFENGDVGNRKMVIRKMYQYFGTNMCREEGDKNIWISMTKNDILHNTPRNNKYIILLDDVRFVNEAEFVIRNKGYLIKVVGDITNNNEYKDEKIREHASETDQDNIDENLIYTTISNDYTYKSANIANSIVNTLVSLCLKTNKL